MAEKLPKMKYNSEICNNVKYNGEDCYNVKLDGVTVFHKHVDNVCHFKGQNVCGGTGFTYESGTTPIYDTCGGTWRITQLISQGAAYSYSYCDGPCHKTDKNSFNDNVRSGWCGNQYQKGSSPWSHYKCNSCGATYNSNPGRCSRVLGTYDYYTCGFDAT